MRHAMPRRAAVTLAGRACGLILARPCHPHFVEVVQILRLPGDHRAMVSEETARLGEWMGELRRLDAEPDPDRPPLRAPRDTHRA